MTVHFVGAGPGAVDLITIRGRDLIAAADVIIQAGSLVNPQLLELARPDCRLHDSATMTLDQIVAVMAAGQAQGESVVRLHSGDPSLYGAIHEQMRRLDRLGIAYDICPGVSSLAGAAAALKIEYTVPEATQSVVITRLPGRTPTPPGETVAGFARHGSSLVLFLSTGRLAELSAQLMAGGRAPDDPAAIVHKATWPGQERVIACTVADLAPAAAAAGVSATALVVVGPCLTRSEAESRLYAADFATGLRPAQP
ncbi:MAG: precorrin-4 C(11)-methyltransferase [Propionibacteriaceae bacterium]|jgi:precorrin-4/cobalt-precorrin-4 C11-methyltransferase|nr:precorrin-4 C(11)-methyltransferase [Propionibacteriaceae bacterium]